MKIGLLVPEFPPDTIGGGGKVFLTLAEMLAQRGHHIEVVTAETFRGPKNQDGNYRFRVQRLAELPHPTQAYRTYMPPFPAPSIARVINILRGCDVVNAHGYGHPMIDIVGLGLDMRRVVFTLHGFLYTIPTQGGPLALTYSIYDMLLGSRMFRTAGRVTAVSSAVRKLASKRGREDCIIINNGVEFAPSGATALPIEVRKEMDKGPYIFAVGRLQWLKGFDVLLRALRVLKDRGVPVRLLIAGQDGGYEAELRSLRADLGLEDSVAFLGFLPNEMLGSLYSNASCFVMSSRTEAFPAAPLEAMAAGTPCVMTSVGGIFDIARSEVDGLLVKPDDSFEMAGAIERVISDRELANRLSLEGPRRAASFNWSKIVSDYERVYRESVA